MRLLCLHGRRQSAGTFSSKLFPSETLACSRSIQGQTIILKFQGHEFVFIDGPIKAESDIPKSARARQTACEMFSWWDSTESTKNKTEILNDGSQALKSIQKAIDSHGKFDGVLGFSQGGALAASLCRKDSFWTPNVAIFCSAYYLDAFALPLKIKPISNEQPGSVSRTLHVWGKLDQIVPPSKSTLLCNWLQGDSQPNEGGHAVPPPPFCNQLISWLDSGN